MATKKNGTEETAVATTNEPKSLISSFGEIEGTMDRPESLEADRAGTEDIGPNDIRLPRLSIAQGLSPQLTPGDGQFIENLKMFEMFNDLTGEVYGRGPLTFVPIRRDVRRIEFRPRTEGGGVLDLDVPANDPRLAWTVEDGVRMPPKATTFVEFVIMLLRAGKAPEPIVLSIKGTNKWNRRASDQLTTFIATRNAAIYAGLYKVDTLVPAKNDSGTFGVPICKNAGFIPKDTPAGAALYAYVKEFHEALSGKNIHINREPGDDDFDPNAIEGGQPAPPPEM